MASDKLSGHAQLRHGRARVGILLASLIIGLSIVVMILWEFQAPTSTHATDGIRTDPSSPTTESPLAIDTLAFGDDATAGEPTIEGADLEPKKRSVHVVELLDGLNHPVSGSRLIRFRRKAIIDESVTAEDGTARFPSLSQPFHILVWPRQWAPFTIEGDLESGHQTVFVPEGHDIDGTVLLDGAPPRQPVQLYIVYDLQWQRIYSYGDLPKEIIRMIGPVTTGTALLTSRDGELRYGGLSEGAIVRLVPSRAFAFADGREVMQLRVPVANLRIDLVTRRQIIGRVLHENGEAASRCKMRADFHGDVDGGDDALGYLGDIGGDGRFRLTIPGGKWSSIAVTIRQSARVMWSTNLAAPWSGPVIDLGDIRVPDDYPLRVVVADSHGRPVSGAVIGTGPFGSDLISAPTSSEGVASIEVGFAGGPLWVGKTGWERVEVRMPAAFPDDELRVTLRPMAKLIVQIADLASDAGQYCLRISPRDVFMDPFEVHPVFCATGSAWGRHSGSGFEFELGDNRELVVGGIKVESPFTMTLLDPAGKPIAQRDAILHVGKDERITLTVSDSPHRIVGRILDQRGEPVPGVRVRVHAEPWPRTVDFSDGNGDFEIAGLFAAEVTCEFAHPDYVLQRRTLKVPMVNERVTVRLDPVGAGNK